MFPCCKVIYFTAYLIGIVFIHFCNIVKSILRTPLRSLWLFLELIVGPFVYWTKELCVLDFMMYYMWPRSIIFFIILILYHFILYTYMHTIFSVSCNVPRESIFKTRLLLKLNRVKIWTMEWYSTVIFFDDRNSLFWLI